MVGIVFGSYPLTVVLSSPIIGQLVGISYYFHIDTISLRSLYIIKMGEGTIQVSLLYYLYKQSASEILGQDV